MNTENLHELIRRYEDGLNGFMCQNTMSFQMAGNGHMAQRVAETRRILCFLWRTFCSSEKRFFFVHG